VGRRMLLEKLFWILINLQGVPRKVSVVRQSCDDNTLVSLMRKLLRHEGMSTEQEKMNTFCIPWFFLQNFDTNRPPISH